MSHHLIIDASLLTWFLIPRSLARVILDKLCELPRCREIRHKFEISLKICKGRATNQKASPLNQIIKIYICIYIGIVKIQTIIWVPGIQSIFINHGTGSQKSRSIGIPEIRSIGILVRLEGSSQTEKMGIKKYIFIFLCSHGKVINLFNY